MNWLFPMFLAGAAAIAVPIALHLLRRWPKRTVAFPSLRFLARTPPQNAQSHVLRRWLVLLFRCIALCLFAMVFARPFFGADRHSSSRALLIVVDNSFSLQAAQRWPSLLEWTRRVINLGAKPDSIGIMSAAPRPSWIVPLNTRPDVALAALANLKPGWETARVEPALRLAADTLAASPATHREVIFVGDHQRVSWAGFNFNRKLPPGVVALFPTIPEPLPRQAALRAPSIRRTESGFHLAIPIQNFGVAHERTLRVFRDAEARPSYEGKLALADGEARTVEVDLPAGVAAPSTFFRCTLDPDDLAADDVAYGVWQSAADRSVLLDPAPARSTADFIAAALASTVDLKPAVHVTAVPSASWPPNAVAILRNDSSFTGESAARLNAFLHSGGSALVFLDGGSAQLAWLASVTGVRAHPVKSEAESLDVGDWAMDHALVADLASRTFSPLLDWKFQRGWSLPAESVEPIALWSASGVAIGETSVGGGRLLICGFAADRRDSEWPVREMFVPFIHRATAYLLGTDPGTSSKPAIVGDTLTVPAEPGTWRALAGPSSATAPATVSGAVTPTAPGVYEFTVGTENRLYAVNLSPEESDPTAWSDGTPWLNLQTPVTDETRTFVRQTRASSADAERDAPLWWWLAAAATPFIMVELGLANRTSR